MLRRGYRNLQVRPGKTLGSTDKWFEYKVLLIIQEKLEMLMLQGVSLEPKAAAREGCPPEGAEKV